MKNRIKTFRQSLGLSQAEFGKRLRLAKTTVCGYETGIKPIPERTVQSICSIFPVNSQWLINGTGEMLRTSGVDPHDFFKKRYRFTDADCEIIDKYRDLSEEKRKMVKHFINAILDEEI